MSENSAGHGAHEPDAKIGFVVTGEAELHVSPDLAAVVHEASASAAAADEWSGYYTAEVGSTQSPMATAMPAGSSGGLPGSEASGGFSGANSGNDHGLAAGLVDGGISSVAPVGHAGSTMAAGEATITAEPLSTSLNSGPQLVAHNSNSGLGVAQGDDGPKYGDEGVPLPEGVDRAITEDGELKADETVITPEGTQIDTGKANTKVTLESGTTISVKPDGTVMIKEKQEDGAIVEHEIDTEGDVTLADGTTIKVEAGVTTIVTPDNEKIIIDEDGTTVDLPDDADCDDLEDPDLGGEGPGGGGPGGGGPSGGGPSGGGGDTGGGGKTNNQQPKTETESKTETEPKKPDLTDLQVSPEALRLDAKKWVAITEAFAKIGANVETIASTPVEFGLAIQLRSGYQAIVTAFGQFVASGSTEFTTISEQLNKSAKEYERQEEENAKKAKSIR